MTHLLTICVCTGVPVSWHVYSQKTTFGSWFFPSTVWVLGMELKSSGLAANTFIP